MVEDTGRPCGRGIVATAALRRCRNVGYRFELGILGCIGTTVTGGATRQTRVVHGGRRPGHVTILVTGIALSGGGNVAGRLGQSIHCGVATVVAARAIAYCHGPCCSRMAHHRRAERSVVVVAGGALGAGRNMGGRLAQRH